MELKSLSYPGCKCLGLSQKRVCDYTVLPRPLEGAVRCIEYRQYYFLILEKKKSDSKMHLALRNCQLVLG